MSRPGVAHPEPQRPRMGSAALIFGCFAAGYFMSYALRSINAVLAPVLQSELGLSHAQLGALTSAYFLAFAAMQWPLGVYLDRLGPRRIDAVLMGVAALGCALMALGQSLALWWWGRALMGVGVSAAFMAALRAFRDRFAPERQGALAAWTLMAGTAGAMTVTVPMAWALPVLGWRGVFGVAAALLALIGLAIWWGVPDDAPGAAAPTEGVWASLRGYRTIYARPLFWRMALPAGVVQGGFVAMQSLWVGPWWSTVLGHGRAVIATQLLLLNATLLLAYLAVGAAAQRWGARPGVLVRSVAVTTVLIVAIELAIAMASGPRAWWLWLLYAAAATPYIVVQPWLALTYPVELAGRALTAFNLVIFLAMFASQWLFGAALDAWLAAGWLADSAFRVTLAGMALVHAACAVAFWAWPKAWRGAQE